jgi:hypothetical protein
MIKAYLLIYTKELGTRPRIKACLNSLPEVISWRSEIPNSFFLLSEASAEQLSRGIKECTGAENPRFFITRLPLNRHGWLGQESWDFLRPAIQDILPKK